MLPLCRVVGLVNPLGDSETLSICLDGIPEARAIELLRSALHEFVSARSSPQAYAEAHVPDGGVLQLEALHAAESDAEDAGVLLTALRNQGRLSKP